MVDSISIKLTNFWSSHPERFWEIPPFRANIIRKIRSNWSELRKDDSSWLWRYVTSMLKSKSPSIIWLITCVMQCAIPVFEGLLPEPHNLYVLKLLFNLAHWHGLTKLWMHTDATVELLAQIMKSLGSNIHTFKKHTCSLFQTWEFVRLRLSNLLTDAHLVMLTHQIQYY